MNTHRDGDVTVGRNVAVGGDTHIAGNMSIGHNVTIKGWLDAPNIVGVNKGVFAALSTLQNKYPNPKDGWYAGVGESAPFDVYIANDGEWVASGGTMGGEQLQINEDVPTKDSQFVQSSGGAYKALKDVSEGFVTTCVFKGSIDTAHAWLEEVYIPAGSVVFNTGDTPISLYDTKSSNGTHVEVLAGEDIKTTYDVTWLRGVDSTGAFRIVVWADAALIKNKEDVETLYGAVNDLEQETTILGGAVDLLQRDVAKLAGWFTDIGTFHAEGGTSEDAHNNANAELNKLHTPVYNGTYTDYQGNTQRVPIGICRINMQGSHLFFVNNVIKYSEDHWQQIAINAVFYSNIIAPGKVMYSREFIDGAWTAWTVGSVDVSVISSIQAQLYDIRSQMLSTKDTKVDDGSLDIADENNNVIARFKNGHIQTKSFDSRLIQTYTGACFDYNGLKAQIPCEGTYQAFVKKVAEDTYYRLFHMETWNGGLAINNDVAIMTFNRGLLIMLNWATKEVMALGELGSVGTSNHANNCSFGVDHYQGNQLPLLYVSECNESISSHNNHRCFVEDISIPVSPSETTGIYGRNIQTITYGGSRCIVDRTVDWAVDRLTGFLYGYGYLTDSQTHNQIRIMKFNIPDINSRNVTLQDTDILEEYDIEIEGIIQGVSVSGGVFAIPTSNVIDGTVTPWKQDAFITMYDLNKKMYIVNALKISSAVDYNEIEGVCLYNGKLNLVLHQSGVQNLIDANFYEVEFK